MTDVYFRKSQDFSEEVKVLFFQQKALLFRKLPFSDIQHIGGTAVPNLLTKGDLDINVRVSAADFSKTVEILKGLYEINQPENWSNSYASFKDNNSYILPVGIQVSVIDSTQDFFLKHRDALLNNPVLVDKFNQVKKAFEAKDMDDYRTAKRKFLEENITST